MTLLSVPAYAAHVGVSKVAAYKWKAKGWLVLDGVMVDVEQTNARLAQYRDPSDARADRKGAHRGGRPKGPPKPPKPPKAPPVPQEGVFDHGPEIQAAYERRLAAVPPPPYVPTGGETFRQAVLDAEDPEALAEALAGGRATTEEARRVKENYLALRGKLDYEREAGNLVDVELATATFFDAARALRNTWLNWPAKFGPLIAADLGLEADRVTEVLTGYVHKQVASLGEPEARFGD